jgi:putative PEP-CTERM system histidine kinase
MKLGFISYLICAVAFTGLLGIVLVGKRGGALNKRLAGAIVFQILWAVVLALEVTVLRLPFPAAPAIEVIRSFVWLVFLLYLPSTLFVATPENPENARLRLLFLAGGFTLVVASIATDLLALGIRWSWGWKLLMCAFGLYCVEQIYRHTPANARWNINLLAISLLAIFGFDLVMFADALLFQTLNPNWWTARGLCNALLMPVLAIGAARARDMKIEFTVSHQLAFKSATLIVSGVYLILTAGAGYYLKNLGGTTAELLQALLAFSAVVVLAVLLFSSKVRARFRVFIAKNFFAYQYDYREEWLKFTDQMSSGNHDQNDPNVVSLRAAEALKRLTECGTASVWAENENGDFVRTAQIGNHSQAPDLILKSDPLVEFFNKRNWVINVLELRDQPDLYQGLAAPSWVFDLNLHIVTPFQLGERTVGFAALGEALVPISLNWEVRDLLKTLGKQTASYLAQQQATRQLIEMQQFDSFNRMSAFVVHDLKNLVAQLSLLMSNAQKHRHNPEFQADVLLTVENVLGRMQGLLLQLRAGAKPSDPVVAIDINRAVREAVEGKGKLGTTLKLALKEESPLMVRGHLDRLSRVIGHLIQNADEACKAKSHDQEDKQPTVVTVTTDVTEKRVLVSVEDNGVGMSTEFIQHKLFRPFNSTKGMGMGIGTFESREYIKELGGEIKVASQIGRGTTFTISLPLVEPHN